MVKVVKYSGVATSQVNPNTDQEHNWVNPIKAVGHNNKTHATSMYRKFKAPTHYTTKTVYDKNGKSKTVKVADKWEDSYSHPWTFAFHDFGFDIPKLAKIKQITFRAKIRTDSNNLKVLCPIACFRINTPALDKKLDTTSGKGYSTGWNNGMYMGVPEHTYLTNQWNTYSWSMYEEDIEDAEIVPNRVNQNIMGVDLVWQDAEEIKGTYDSDNKIRYHVQVAWVECDVWYDLQDYQLSIENPKSSATKVGSVDSRYMVGRGTKNSPFVVNIDSSFNLDIKCINKSDVSGDNKYITFRDLKWADMTINSMSDGTSYAPVEAMGTGVWTIPHKANASYNMNITITPKGAGLNKLVAYMYDGISGTEEPLSATAYYFTTINKYGSGGDSEIIMYAVDNGDDNSPDNDFHKNSLCCLNIDVNGQTFGEQVTVTVDPSFTHTLPLNVSEYFSLNYELSTTGITIDSQTEDSFVLNIPSDVDEYHASVRMCFIPTEVGSFSFRATTSDIDVWYTKNFDILYPYEYHLQFGKLAEGDIIKINNHRIITKVTVDSSVIPLVADEIDSSMIMDDCHINMNILEDLDYIGCVPLEHLHFDPKSTYKDTLLNSTYKNKRYMGKKLATDEDITLNVRLHPHQVTTIQGLIEIDKPIPINANHRCFEGDALNHRGWAEIYSIKSEITNPRWYKCDIDVKYLTHNLKTRFTINRGESVYDYKIPQLYTTTVPFGQNLSDLVETETTNLTDDSEVEENVRTFTVDTDGTFMYIEDVDEEERNLFSIDNGESIFIKLNDKLPSSSEVVFNWESTLLKEDKENAVSRIIKLIDQDGNSLVEYEYTDIAISDDEVEATVIVRSQGEIDRQDDITFRYTPSDDDEGTLARYGSTVSFRINKNMLSIFDEGFSGMEFTLSDIKLKSSDFYYAVEWKNNNDDGESNSIDTFMDFQVNETVLTTTYSDTFGRMIVSPFPIADKNLLFTRNAEEGVIYYYQIQDGGENEEFSFIIEPFYQYINGTDLKGDGVSIFNLNYGHEIVYIQNGLVRMGFNRVDEDGHMYLGKYDPISEDYITTHTFHLGKYTDLNLNSISDDKIEVQASDSTFTIYRGHPYIKINHATEDIYIDTVFNSVWADQVGDGDAQELPSNWSLLNDDNLLPLSVGGKGTINASDISVSEVTDSDRTDVNLAWASYPSDFTTDTDLTWTLTGDAITGYSDEVYVGGDECSFGTYTFEVESDGEPYRLSVSSNKSVMMSGENTSLTAKLTDFSGTGVSDTTIYFFEAYDPTTLRLTGDKTIIQTGESVDFSVKLLDEDGSGIQGETVGLYQICDGIGYDLMGDDEITSWTSMTNQTANGIYTSHGSYLTDGWDNTRLWTLDFDYKYDESTYYIGLMPICSEEINPYTDAKRTNYAITTWEGSFPPYGLGFSSWTSAPESYSINDQRYSWNHIKIKKTSNTTLEITLNDTYTWVGEFPNLANLTELHIGSRDNPSGRNKGSSILYKNIEVVYNGD